MRAENVPLQVLESTLLLEKGKLKDQKHTLFHFCSPYMHNKTTSFPEIALELLYPRYFKSYSHIQFSQIFVIRWSRFQFIKFMKQFCDSILNGFFSNFYYVFLYK